MIPKLAFATLIAVLASAWPASAQTTAPGKGREPSLLPPADSGSRTPQRLRTAPDDDLPTEIRKPESIDETEWRVLHSLGTMPLNRLVEILLVYERLDNPGMTDAIVSAILQRDPQNKEAIRVRDGLAGEETIRAPGYLDEIARKVLAGQKVDDPDSVPVAALSMVLEGRAAEAVTLLEALRKNQFAGATFPYLDDLAYALTEAGRYAEAVAAYRNVLEDPNQSAEAKVESRTALPAAETRLRIANIRQSAGLDWSRLLAESERLMKESPSDVEVIAFRVEVLNAARQSQAAIDLLLDLRKRQAGVDPWPWLPELAFSYFGARQYDTAIATFREIQSNPAFDDMSRREAENMILEIQVQREIETGLFALQRADTSTAKRVLDKLDRDYKTHRDVVGYRAMYLVKTGKPDEALRVLEERRKLEAAENLPFSQQDSLADVYLEMKQFDQARSAIRVILADPRYDAETRAQAELRLKQIDVEESLHFAYLALQDGDRAKARQIANELRQTVPNSIETRLLDAEVALAYFNARFARDELQALRDAPFPQGYAGMPFPGMNSLAAAQAQLGDWQTAYDTYGTVLTSPGYEAEDLWEAKWERRNLQSWFMPTLTARGTYTHESEGDLYTASLDYHHAWTGDWRFGAFLHDTSARLGKGSIFYKSKTGADIFEGGITAMRRFDNRWFAEAMVGASQDDVLYGLRVGQLAYRSIGWSLGFVGNALSTDSVNLQAINGRENRVEFKLSGPLTDRVLVDFNAWYQWNRVGGDRLGQGYGASGEIDYILQTETSRRPEFSIGYVFDYSRFDRANTVPSRVRSSLQRSQGEEIRQALDPNQEVRRALASNFGSEVFDSLVDPYTNRHGIVLRARKNFDRLAVSAHIGGYYAIDDHGPGWTAGAAVEYWLSETAMIYAELSYDSAGKGASSDGGVWEAVIGGQVTF